MFDWMFAYMLPEVAEQWNYAMVTLIVRFIGVFVVMAIMQVALQLSSRAVRSLENRREAGDRTTVPLATAPSPARADLGPVEEEGLDSPTLAAIGLALALESRHSYAAPSSSPSAWSAPWRVRQLPHGRRR